MSLFHCTQKCFKMWSALHGNTQCAVINVSMSVFKSVTVVSVMAVVMLAYLMMIKDNFIHGSYTIVAAIMDTALNIIYQIIVGVVY